LPEFAVRVSKGEANDLDGLSIVAGGEMLSRPIVAI
jgi:hypothetical protein